MVSRGGFGTKVDGGILRDERDQGAVLINKDAGFFKDEGLDADLLDFLASSTRPQPMLAGEVAISTANSQVIVDSGLFPGSARSNPVTLDEIGKKSQSETRKARAVLGNNLVQTLVKRGLGFALEGGYY